MDNPTFKISIEDKFIIIQLNVEDNLLPEGHMLDNIVDLFYYFSKSYQIILDFRGVKYITRDLIDLLDLFTDVNAKLLLNEASVEDFKEKFSTPIKILPVKTNHTPYNYHEIDTYIFSNLIEDLQSYNHIDLNKNVREEYKKIEIFKKIASSKPPTKKEIKIITSIFLPEETLKAYKKIDYDLVISDESFEEIFLRKRYFENIIDKHGRNSLMTEFVFGFEDNQISIAPYHSHATNNIQTKDGVLIGRPAVIARKTHSILKKQFDSFKDILSRNKIKENEIQKYLEENPEILKSLGYKKIYPKVVLQRDDGSYLEPDFMLEPFGDRWCDILDLKLPNLTPIVGDKDRKKFSESIQSLIAQLREYGAHFENEKYAKRVEDVYGIKCYKPRLIGVAGTASQIGDERQARRIITQYSDVDIVSFDRLIEISRSRILI